MVPKLIKKMNNEITDSTNNTVSNLILTTNISFEKHVKKFIEIDKINDRNAKKLYKSKEDLLAWINSKNELEKIHGQIVSYLHLAQKELPPKQIEKYVKIFAKACQQANKVDVNESKLIYKYKKQIVGYLNSPLLQSYKRWFKARYFCEQDHTIDETERRIMQEIRGTKPIDALFRATISGDFNMPPPTDANGNRVLTGNLNDWLHSSDHNVRIDAWEGYVNYITSKINAIGEIIKIKIFRSWQNAKFREFKTMFDMDMHDYEIPTEVGDRIFKTCKLCQEEFTQFIDYCDKTIPVQVGAKEILPWDRMKGVGTNPVKISSKQEAQEDIINALSILGDEYSKIVKTIFDEKWIDWNHNPDDGRTNMSFAFAGNNKYPIKINFQNQAQQVIVLAHEIGHSIAAELSKKNNAYEGINELLTEIPSFVNETLMTLYYLNRKYRENSKLEHLSLCFDMMQRLYSNICEQSVYVLTANELEKTLLNSGNLFTKQIIQIYRQVKQEYGAVTDADRKWMKQNDMLALYDIPNLPNIFGFIGTHDTLPYYLGASIGVCIALDIFNGKPQAKEKYLKFLKMGSTKDPIASLKTLGYDVTRPTTFRPLIYICRQLVDELNKYKAVNKNDPSQLKQYQEQQKSLGKKTLQYK